MEITDITVHIVALSDIDAEKSDGTQDASIIEVNTDEGITGIGEADSSPSLVKSIIEAPSSHGLSTGLREIVIGRDPYDVEVLWNEMFSKSYYYGRKGAAITAISGIDMALWDIIGKDTGRPLHKLLGGKHEREIRAYASTLFPDELGDIAHMKREAERAVEDGFTAIKFGWGCFGQDIENDIMMLTAVREVIGSDIDIMVDAGMVWENDPKASIKSVNRIDDEIDVFWVEEPVAADNFEGYAKLSNAVKTRVVGGEEEYTLYGFKHLIEKGEVDAIQPDVARAGGITHMKKIASLAQAHSIPFIPHAFSTDILIAANLHLIASQNNAPLLEYSITDSPIRWDLVNEDFPVEGGTVSVPERPGLGVSLNKKIVNKLRYEP